MKKILLLVSLLYVTISLKAQSFYEMYKEDVSTYMTHYAKPLFEANMLNFSDAWVHRAGTEGAFSVSLSISAHYATVPEKYQSFYFIPSEYTHFQLADASGNIQTDPTKIPTVFGGKTEYKIRITAPHSVPGTVKYVDLKALQGFKQEIEDNIKYLPVGMPGANMQLTVGFPFHTQVMLRYFPKVSYSGIGASLFGVGLKHEIGHYFLKDNKHFHIAAFADYAGGSIQASYPSVTSLTADFHVNTYQIGAGVSYDAKIFSIYSNVSFIRGTSRLDIKGDYTYDYDIKDNSGHTIGTQSETITDPLSLQYALNTYKIATGIYVNIWILRIFAQYNIQRYPGFQAGISMHI